MRFEVAGFGVKVVIVEPGLITTNFENAAVASMDGNDDGAYSDFNTQVAKATKEVYAGPMRHLGGGPDAVAKVIEKSLDARRPRIRYTVTPSAALSIRSRNLMGARGWDAVLRSQFPQPKGSAPASD
jgi:NAD(P)-dependent dehydrogenase (short-subunit alcohol dehydrogenase family)